MSAGSHNSAHSRNWRGPSSRALRGARKAWNGLKPVDLRRLETLLKDEKPEKDDGEVKSMPK